jgi:hypothetical protein
MAKERAHIIAMYQGIPKGYVKSVSYTAKKFVLTDNKMLAKGYVTHDAIQKEIDFLTSIGYAYGYVFIYD